MIVKTLSSLAAAAALAAAAIAPAHAAFSIDGILVPEGAVFSTINLFEGERLGGVGNQNGVIDQLGEELVGVGLVTSIQDQFNNTIWANGQNGKRLTILIQGFTAGAITPFAFPGTNGVDISFTGGEVKIFSQAAGAFNASGSQAAVLAAASAGNLWLDLDGSASGGFVGVNPITLKSRALNDTGGNPLLDSLNVTGQGFLDVVGGLAQASFDTDRFGCIAANGAPCPDLADIKFTSSGQLNAILPGQQEFGFRGTGEISAFSVPLPGSLALAGLALMGAGFASRRARTNKA